MTEKEPEGLKYIRHVFEELPSERKDHVLDIARSLLAIQEDAVYHPVNGGEKEY